MPISQYGIEFIRVKVTENTPGGTPAPRSFYISGWSDDADALTMPEEWEGFSIKYGALGDMRVFRNGMRGGEVTLKLLPGSKSANELEAINDANIQASVKFGLSGNGVQTIKTYDMVVTDTVTKRIWTCSNGIMTKGPIGQSVGAADASNRMFTFTFEVIELDSTMATSLENDKSPSALFEKAIAAQNT